MLMFFHLSDPIPLYRAGQWTFLGGAVATVDRPLLGFIRWICILYAPPHYLPLRVRFLLNSPTSLMITSAPLSAVAMKIKPVLAEHYNCDSTVQILGRDVPRRNNLCPQNISYALYRPFTQCLFVDGKGEIGMMGTIPEVRHDKIRDWCYS
ncbi:hypothetical protein B0H19DRAFT_970402 [Mycena capillaripes]|nr:hypothetical protein B0H19DRAFT_970402 [Mycena capillaripes]